MEKICNGVGRDIRRELYAILTKGASERPFSACSIDQQPYNHTDMAMKGGITQTCCRSDLQTVELKSYIKAQRG